MTSDVPPPLRNCYGINDIRKTYEGGGGGISLLLILGNEVFQSRASVSEEIPGIIFFPLLFLDKSLSSSKPNLKLIFRKVTIMEALPFL